MSGRRATLVGGPHDGKVFEDVGGIEIVVPSVYEAPTKTTPHIVSDVYRWVPPVSDDMKAEWHRRTNCSCGWVPPEAD